MTPGHWIFALLCQCLSMFRLNICWVLNGLFELIQQAIDIATRGYKRKITFFLSTNPSWKSTHSETLRNTSTFCQASCSLWSGVSRNRQRAQQWLTCEFQLWKLFFVPWCKIWYYLFGVASSNPVIGWDEATILDQEPDKNTRWLQGSIWIRSRGNKTMNMDEGAYRPSWVYDQIITKWQPLLNSLAIKSSSQTKKFANFEKHQTRVNKTPHRKSKYFWVSTISTWICTEKNFQFVDFTEQS